jgi:hypothetical protein
MVVPKSRNGTRMAHQISLALLICLHLSW